VERKRVRFFERLGRWARGLKRDLLVLYLAARDPRVPWYAKLIAAVVAAYAFSPIDLIPDVVPILGYLDDLILLPLGIALALRLIPADVLEELRRTASERSSARPRSWLGATCVLLLWVGLAAFSGWWIAQRLFR
jgi:uncharacterized membrane protein YkvA (DUF1232 family)